LSLDVVYAALSRRVGWLSEPRASDPYLVEDMFAALAMTLHDLYTGSERILLRIISLIPPTQSQHKVPLKRVRLFLLLDPVQKVDPLHGEGDGGEILLHLSFQEIGPHLVQHVAELVIDFREEDRLIDACRVLEGDELHGVALPGLYGLAGNQPPNGGDMLTHVEMKIASVHVM